MEMNLFQKEMHGQLMINDDCTTCMGECNRMEELYKKQIVTKCNTTVEVKRKYWPVFSNMVMNQFNHGGEKYLLDGFDDREATDVISSVFGGKSEFNWILGTMTKYIFRFKNFEREKDLLKIATYCFILWLKQGNHLKTTHEEDISK